MCIQLACSWRPRAFEEAHRRNIQAKFYNEKFPLVWKKTTYETHYMKNMVLLWSTKYETHYMKNKVLLWSTSVEKEIVTLPLLFIFIIFYFFSFFLWPFFLSFWPFPFFLWDNALIMMIITLSLITTYELQLETRTRYDSIWMPPAVYRDVQWSSVAMTTKNGQAMKTSC